MFQCVQCGFLVDYDDVAIGYKDGTNRCLCVRCQHVLLDEKTTHFSKTLLFELNDETPVGELPKRSAITYAQDNE